MRRYIPLVLLLAACGDGSSPVDPPEVPEIVGDYTLIEVAGAPPPVTIGWYTVESAARSFREDGTYAGEAEITFTIVEADTVAHYHATLAETGTWTHRDGPVYDLTATQQLYRRRGGQEQRWSLTDTLSVAVAGSRVTGGTLLYPSAILTYQR